MLRTAMLAFAAAFLMSTASLACSGQTSASADHKTITLAEADTSKTPPTDDHHTDDHHSEDEHKH